MYIHVKSAYTPFAGNIHSTDIMSDCLRVLITMINKLCYYYIVFRQLETNVNI